MNYLKKRSRWTELIIIKRFLVVIFIGITSEAAATYHLRTESSNNSYTTTKNNNKERTNLVLPSSSSSLASEPNKSVQSYNNNKTEFDRSNNAVNNHRRPLNVLALGGSVTWGARLNNRKDAYPWKLVDEITHPHSNNNVQVDNLAMRATGADYPSICLESILLPEGQKNYDLILLEFVMNGTNGFSLLLRRLRDRYPDAVILFVGIWSLKSNALENKTGKRVHDLGEDPNIDWVWKKGDFFSAETQKNTCGRDICDSKEIKRLLNDARAYFYEWPMPDSPKKAIDAGWFSSDWVHLSPLGHQVVANGIIEFLSDKYEALFSSNKRLVSLTRGDQCYNWLMTGQMPLEFRGGSLIHFPDNRGKFSLEIDSMDGSTITIHSDFDRSVPLGLGFMRQFGYQTNQGPGDYPSVEVTINGMNPVLVDPYMNDKIELSYHLHVTAYSQIGWVEPGRNLITITPVELRSHPFRLIGIYLCAVCAESGSMGSGAIETQQTVELGDEVHAKK